MSTRRYSFNITIRVLAFFLLNQQVYVEIYILSLAVAECNKNTSEENGFQVMLYVLAICISNVTVVCAYTGGFYLLY